MENTFFSLSVFTHEYFNSRQICTNYNTSNKLHFISSMSHNNGFKY